MKLPQFTIRDLLIGTALIAVGFALLSLVAAVYAPVLRTVNGVLVAERRFGALSFYVGAVGLLGGPALILGGFLYPFGKTRLGMILGAIFGVLLYASWWAALFLLYRP